MAEPFLAEIRMMSFSFPPNGWALCDGQLLPISQNQALFSLLGTLYGGDGSTNFALPDLRGRVPMHEGAGHTLGERGGAYAHTLSVQEMPQHGHTVAANSSVTGGVPDPANNFLGGGQNLYHAPQAGMPMRAATVTNAGGGQAHENTQPYTVISFCIALQGIFPSPN
jgi:microcystin-dependent protein